MVIWNFISKIKLVNKNFQGKIVNTFEKYIKKNIF